MPIYRLTVEKYYSTLQEYWVNVYHVNAEAGVPTSVMNDLVEAEKPLYDPTIIITKVSQDDVAVDSNYASPLIVNANGTRTGPGGDRHPLFLVARCDFTYAGSRPGRKYLRGVLYEVDSGLQTLSAGMLTILQTYCSAILAIPGLCDADGDDLTGAVPFNAPAMRQLRRGKKRSVTP